MQRSLQGLCVKILKVGHDHPEGIRKTKCLDMHRNELGALVRANEAGVPGVVKLVASTTWDGYPALVLEYHGK